MSQYCYDNDGENGGTRHIVAGANPCRGFLSHSLHQYWMRCGILNGAVMGYQWLLMLAIHLHLHPSIAAPGSTSHFLTPAKWRPAHTAA